jgi:hypothetical protein
MALFNNGRKTGKRPALLGLVWLAFIIGAGFVSAAHADGDEKPSLDLGKPYLRGGDVWLDLSMSAMISGEVLDALHCGLPATIVFEWRIWQRRDGWWDKEVDNGATYFRVFYDVLQNRYDVFDRRGRSLASSDDSGDIERVISEGPGLKLVSASVLHAQWRYYVEVMARIELLDEEEVRKLQEWLAGSGGRKSGLDPVGKISEQLGQFLGGIIGPSEKTMMSKTDDFPGF